MSWNKIKLNVIFQTFELLINQTWQFIVKITQFNWNISTAWNIYPWEIANWRCPDATVSLGPVSHDFGVNSAGYAVVKLRVELGEGVVVVDTGVSDVPNSSSLDDVADDELLDRLVFRHATGAVGASHGVYVATTVLGTSTVPSLARLLKKKFLFSKLRIIVDSSNYQE